MNKRKRKGKGKARARARATTLFPTRFRVPCVILVRSFKRGGFGAPRLVRVWREGNRSDAYAEQV